MDACSECPAGTYTYLDTTLFVCAQCEMGSLQPLPGQVSCTLCSSGRYMNVTGSTSAACPICRVGTVSPSEGSRECEECRSSSDFMPLTGRSQCFSCPANAIAALSHSSCHCEINYYAVPTLDLVRALDNKAYTAYEQAQSTTYAGFDPNQFLGFWCAQCPEGAGRLFFCLWWLRSSFALLVSACSSL